MDIYSSIFDIQNQIKQAKLQGKTIGFVPTMGALHDGHLALVRQAASENSIAVASIFVNPTQFNNPDDLLKYPRNLDRDLELLQSAGCAFVFVPEVDEMYPQGVKSKSWDFGFLGQTMEGLNRPGHFDGVATVVSKLFEAVPANKAYFGKKDYQQLLIIKEMVKQLGLETEIIPCEIVRHTDGLAMSSRNVRLSEEQRNEAPLIYRTLRQASIMAKNAQANEVVEFVNRQINSSEFLQVEYFQLAHADTLRPVHQFVPNQSVMGFVVVNVEGVRLIDNIQII